MNKLRFSEQNQFMIYYHRICTLIESMLFNEAHWWQYAVVVDRSLRVPGIWHFWMILWQKLFFRFALVVVEKCQLSESTIFSTTLYGCYLPQCTITLQISSTKYFTQQEEKTTLNVECSTPTQEKVTQLYRTQCLELIRKYEFLRSQKCKLSIYLRSILERFRSNTF